MNDFITRLCRSIVSYLPSPSLFTLRSLRDVPDRLRQRPHEPDFVAFGPFDGPGAVFVDVGANRGQSIRSLRLFAPQATIHAFEPNPLLAAYLDRSGGMPLVETHNCGLGAAPGSMQLHLPRYGNTIYDTRAALTESDASSFLNKEHFVAFRQDRASMVIETVEISTLDAFELAPAAVKIDVEGADLEVILGGWETISAHLPLLMIEFPSEETTRRLAGIGYESMALADNELVATQAELNTLFVQPNHRAAISALLSRTR